MTGKTPKGDATRRAIIAAAGGVFARNGYAGTRMEQIFAATGLTKGAVYFHFASKEELARAVVEDYKERWLEQARAEIGAHEGALEQFRGLAALLIRLSAADESNWSVVRLAEQLSAQGESDSSSASGPMAHWVALMSEVIDRGQRQGVFASTPPAVDLAVVAVAAFDGLKTTSDALGADARDAFARRAGLLVELLESGFRV